MAVISKDIIYHINTLPFTFELTSIFVSHIFLKHWYKAFPDLHIWLCPTRAHHTKNLQEIRNEYPERWELADNTTTPHHVHQLLDYFDGVDVVLFNQLFVHADERGGIWRHCGDETKKFSNLDLFKSILPAMGAQDSASDEPVFYYAPLKLIVTGHHWEVRPGMAQNVFRSLTLQPFSIASSFPVHVHSMAPQGRHQVRNERRFCLDEVIAQDDVC